MKKGLAYCLFVCICMTFAQGQQVHFQLRHVPLRTDSASVFLAGSFNSWNPSDSMFRFSSRGQLSIRLQAPANIAYKCTKGSWHSVETDALGNDIDNRSAKISGDTTIYLDVLQWKTDAQKRNQNTATASVHVFDTAFLFPTLNATKRVLIYMPPDYDRSAKRYPVLYMHDGQNVFNKQTAAFGEWKVDETLDSIFSATGRSMLVVAIYHGGDNRMAEYSPMYSDITSNPQGKNYLQDLVGSLKPAIDKNFRTHSQPSHTWIAGSSLGGLISAYALLAYAEVFGGGGIFSPSFWVGSATMDSLADKRTGSPMPHWYFYAGGKESRQMLADMEKFAAKVCSADKGKCQRTVNAEGKHSETDWALQFPAFAQFMIQAVHAAPRGSR